MSYHICRDLIYIYILYIMSHVYKNILYFNGYNIYIYKYHLDDGIYPLDPSGNLLHSY